MRIKNNFNRHDIYNIYDVCEDIVDKDIFKKQFDIFTDFQLHLINWDNVLVVGESLLISLKSHLEDNKHLRKKFREQYKTSIYLCIYGLDEIQLINKRKELI